MKTQKTNGCYHLLLVLSLLLLLPFQPLKALEYTLQFEASSDTLTVDSVIVENVTRQQTIKLGGRDVLKLTDQPVGLHSLEKSTKNRLNIYPNPSHDGTIWVSFQSDAQHVAQLMVVDLAGKTVLSKQVTLRAGQNSFSLIHVPTGICHVVVTAGSRRYSGKLINTALERGSTRLYETNGETAYTQTGEKPNQVQAAQQERYMHFETGDRLRLLGMAGIDKCVRMVSPHADSILSFDFYRCVDGEGHSYPTVTIGNQVWMAENLRTTLYNDGSHINKITDAEQWYSGGYNKAYGWYDNDSVNSLPFGALYRGYAVLSINLAPKGWHVPSEEEFQVLMDAVNHNPSHLISGRSSDWNSLPNPPYDSTGFGAKGAGFYGRSGYEGRLEMTSFWTTTQSQIPSAPMRRSDSGVRYSEIFTNYFSIVEICPQWMNMSGSSAAGNMSIRCVKNEAPTVKMDKLLAVKEKTAGFVGRIVNNGGETIIANGFCWSSNHSEPTLSDNVVVAGAADDNLFSAILNGLESGVTYSIRAFARNTVGVSYSEVKTFSTTDIGTVTDIDNQVYQTVKIGEQVWMAENLRVTRYNDGTSIPQVNSPSAWSVTTLGARCLYDTLATVDEYGYLYNQKAIQTRKLAPLGWHVPTKSEWSILVASISPGDVPSDVVSRWLRESGSAHWLTEYADGSNISGFTALPGGFRNASGESLYKGKIGYFWSTTHEENDDTRYYSIGFDHWTISDTFWALSAGLSVRCLKDYPAKLTTYLKNVTQTTASIGGQLIEAGGVLKRVGLCWSMTDVLPNVDNAQVILLDSMEIKGEQWLNLDTLTPGATYHLRAFAENSTGVSYGPLVTFSTPSSNTVVDLDGNQYHTIKIGTQTWMVENLKTTKYNDGTAIGGVSGYHSTSPGYTVYAYDNSNTDTYGLLYNWYAVNTGKLAPTGWRVPTQQDWQTLINYLGGENAAGGKLKEAGLEHWQTPNTGAIDWGFKALPGGTRDGSSAYFRAMRSRGWWWASTPGEMDYNACTFELVSFMSDAYLGQGYKSDAFSVRCIKVE